nr:unnamed protein product [Spirometra erinaceieuropaei]
MTPSTAPGCCSPSGQAVATAAAASASASPAKSTVVNRDVVWVRGSQGWHREQSEQTERSRKDNGEERKTGKQEGLTSNYCGQSAQASYEEWTHGSYERVQQQIQLIEQACRERERERMERERCVCILSRLSDTTRAHAFDLKDYL